MDVCDTVPLCHGIGKTKMMKIVNAKKYSLTLVGEVMQIWKMSSTSNSLHICVLQYAMSNTTSMTEARIKVWTDELEGKQHLNLSSYVPYH